MSLAGGVPSGGGGPGGADPGGSGAGGGSRGSGAGGCSRGGGSRRADYAEAGFAARIGWGRSPALLVVDAVRAYTEPGSPLFLESATGALAAMVSLVGAARAGGFPVLWTTVTYRRGGREAPLFRAKIPALSVFEDGSPLGAWPGGLGPFAGEAVVAKHFASAFFGTDLASGLTAGGVDTVVVAGFSTSGCVRASALDALQHGFRPVVVADAVGDRDPGVHDANLFDLDAKYADVVGLAEALGSLEHLAAGGRPEAGSRAGPFPAGGGGS